MYKLEIICENCDKHFVLITREEILDEAITCCFCNATLDLTSSDEEDE